MTTEQLYELELNPTHLDVYEDEHEAHEGLHPDHEGHDDNGERHELEVNEHVSNTNNIDNGEIQQDINENSVELGGTDTHPAYQGTRRGRFRTELCMYYISQTTKERGKENRREDKK